MCGVWRKDEDLSNFIVPYMSKEELLFRMKKGASISILAELNGCRTFDIINALGDDYKPQRREHSGRSLPIFDATSGVTYDSMIEASQALECAGLSDVSHEFIKSKKDEVCVKGHTLRKIKL